MKIKVREEFEPDQVAVRRVNKLAFGQEEEADLVTKLRALNDVVISLVAEVKGEVVGHLLLSRMYVQTGEKLIPILALGPIAVIPELQKKGIGSTMVFEAIKRVTHSNESIILAVGHKEYYPRFGFSASLAQNIESPFGKDRLMALELRPGALKDFVGIAKYSKAFNLDPEWTKE